MGLSAGWSARSRAGGTSIGLGYNRSTDGLEASAQQYWVAIVQKIDASAADVYAGVSYDSGSVTHTVSAAEASNTYAAAVAPTSATDRGSAEVIPAATPCYYAGDTAGQFARAAAGDTCEVERDGVLNFLVGVRLKF